MNTYNENLQNTVLASLQSQDLDEKNLNAQYNASKFTLYYAQGAAITASEKLASAQDDQGFKAQVKEQATHSNNIATNLLNSATQANQYMGQSISNAAVCAANVQIAATSVTRLASDVGSIFSIVNAADFDTDIYALTNEVKGLVDDTAYLAEYSSQMAMDASTSTSEVSAATVLDNTKTTTAQMSNLLQIAGAAYDTSSQVVNADNAALASTRAIEKTAEGAIECIGIDYDSSKLAYEYINRALNLDLRVQLAADLKPFSPESATSFTVTFNCIKSPFPFDPLPKVPPVNPPPKGYPVQSYYILVVKESKKLVFSLSDAENIVLTGGKEQQFAAINADKITDGHVTYPINYLKFIKEKKDDKDQNTDQQPKFKPMLDTDGDAVAAGQNYVVVVMAVYLTEYKRKINDFDEYLSAPSQAFCMTEHLLPAQNVNVGPVPSDEKTKKDDEQYQRAFSAALIMAQKPGLRLADMNNKAEKSPDFTHQLTFSVTGEAVSKVTYRCMLLPMSDNVPGFLTANAFKTFFALEAMLANVSNIYDPQIKDCELQAGHLEIEIQQVSEDGDRKTLQDKLNAIRTKAANLEKEKNSALEKSLAIDKGGPGFVFDLALAEQVSSGNYMPAVPYKTNADNAGQQDLKGDNKPLPKQYIAYIGPATTDNFGNMLVKKNKYLPVVLSVSTVTEENLAQYTNAISDMNKATPFEY
jgi:hypothetical protein